MIFDLEFILASNAAFKNNTSKLNEALFTPSNCLDLTCIFDESPPPYINKICSK